MGVSFTRYFSAVYTSENLAIIGEYTDYFEIVHLALHKLYSFT